MSRIIVPLGCLLLVFFTDWGSTLIWGDQTLAPLLSVLSLFGLAMVCGPFQILAWLPFFALSSYWLIVSSSQFPLTRTITVVLAGLMAAWASRQREKVDEQLGEIEAILAHLPTPWALLNEEGAILKSNPAGADLLGSTPEEIAGNSIFDVGSSGQTERRRRIEDFMKVPQTGAPQALVFQLERSGEQKVPASIFRIPTRRGKLSLVVFQFP